MTCREPLTAMIDSVCVCVHPLTSLKGWGKQGKV
jgi:hypothetical protein